MWQQKDDVTEKALHRVIRRGLAIGRPLLHVGCGHGVLRDSMLFRAGSKQFCLSFDFDIVARLKCDLHTAIISLDCVMSWRDR